MSQMKHVQIAVPDGKTCTRIGAVADARTQSDARTRLQPHGYRNLERFGGVFIRCDDDLFETLGVGEVPLCFAERRVGEDLSRSVGQMTAQETVRIIGRPRDVRDTEIIFFTRIQQQIDTGGCGGGVRRGSRAL